VLPKICDEPGAVLIPARLDLESILRARPSDPDRNGLTPGSECNGRAIRVRVQIDNDRLPDERMIGEQVARSKIIALGSRNSHVRIPSRTKQVHAHCDAEQIGVSVLEINRMVDPRPVEDGVIQSRPFGVGSRGEQ